MAQRQRDQAEKLRTKEGAKAKELMVEAEKYMAEAKELMAEAKELVREAEQYVAEKALGTGLLTAFSSILL